MPLGISSGWWTLFTLLIGGVTTLVATIISNWNRRSAQNQRVRSALQNEVKQLGEPLQRLYIIVLLEINPGYNIDSIQTVDFDAIDPTDHKTVIRSNIKNKDISYVEEVFNPHSENIFRTDVYESNVGEIGIFHHSESKKLISFYSRIAGIEYL